jgi:hypothetical protein
VPAVWSSGGEAMTDTKVLLAAADLIERNGLHDGEEWPGADRGEEWHPGDPCCVLGAIALVTGDFPDAALVRKLRAVVGGGVSTWRPFEQ